MWYIESMFVDSHCHLEMEDFDRDRRTIVEQSLKEGLTYILTVGTEEKYFPKVVEMIDDYPSVYGAVGVHPHNSSAYNDQLERTITGLLSHPKIVAYGEIGLDFFRNYAPRETQIESFKRQLQVANDAGLPVIVHSRNAREETLQILSESWRNGSSGVIHCYSYDLKTAKKMLDMGFHISIPGTITYKGTEGLAEVVRYIPPSRLLAETDAPFLTPLPHRGKRNVPYFVKLTIEKIAAIKGAAVEIVADQIAQNFRKLFLEAAHERGLA
jgi:TatD DNase family protein